MFEQSEFSQQEKKKSTVVFVPEMKVLKTLPIIKTNEDKINDMY